MSISTPYGYALQYDNGPMIGTIWWGNGIWELPIGGDYIWNFVPNQPDGGKWNDLPEIQDLTPLALQAGTDPRPLNYGWNWELEWGTTTGSYYRQPERWQEEVVDFINEQVQWVWGDVYGGLGIKREPGGTYKFLATYGMIQSESDPLQYKILATESGDFNLTDLYNGAFSWYFNITSKNGNDYTGSNYGGVYWVNHNNGWNGGQDIAYYSNPTAGIVGGSANIVYELHTNADLYMTLNNKWSHTIFGGTYPSLAIVLNSVNSPYAGSPWVYSPQQVPDGWKLVKGGVNASTSSADSNETPAGSGGGDGNYDNDSDSDDFPGSGQFATDVFNTGLITCFNPTKNKLIDFADFLYSDSMTEAISKKLKYLLDSPLDYIIGLNVAHFTPTTDGVSTINLGGVSTGVTGVKVVNPQIQFIDCGEVNISDQINSFLDYEGSTVQLYLPYCGTHTLDINEVMGGSIWVQYVIDCMNGACTAIVKVQRQRSYVHEDPNLDHTMYYYTGNCFSQVPLTARDYNNILNGLFQIAGGCTSIASGVVGGASGNPMGAVSGTLNGGMNIVQGAINMNKASVTRLGNYASNYGYMQKQKPFVILHRPMASVPSGGGFEERYGRPIHNYLKVSSCYGYTEIDTDTLWTDVFDEITNEEEQMLKEICNKGIWISADSTLRNYNP